MVKEPRGAHNPKVGSSNLSPATKSICLYGLFLGLFWGRIGYFCFPCFWVCWVLRGWFEDPFRQFWMGLHTESA